MADNNTRLKHIVGAFELTRADIAGACELGGQSVSKNLPDSWLRSAQAVKDPSGQSRHKVPSSRRRAMTDQAFDALCGGLKPLVDEIDREK